MPDPLPDMVTVPAGALHAVLGVFARISHLAESPAVQELRAALGGGEGQERNDEKDGQP